ncbi:MAG TPA: fatty acid desaturase [Vicinamibacterales bacterium]|nr:fatty acid desaturase [Vicinamibacterales bacterium]
MAISSTAVPQQKMRYSLTSMHWLTAVIVVLLHLGAFWALFHVSWVNVAAALLLHWVVVGLGICVGYHRLLTHRGFKTSKAFEYFLVTCGTFALEGSPSAWVATHRMHHQFSDKDGDPHSPREGGFWAHMGWILFGDRIHNTAPMRTKYAPDLEGDRYYQWLNTWHWVPMTIVALVVWAAFGPGVAAWSMIARMVFGLHFCWFVNSAAHMWGTRRFETRDDSRNNWWVALLTFGEGWHNNHHAHPVSARHGLAWYELDIAWLTLRAFRAVGLVTDIKVAKIRQPIEASEAA